MAFLGCTVKAGWTSVMSFLPSFNSFLLLLKFLVKCSNANAGHTLNGQGRPIKSCSPKIDCFLSFLKFSRKLFRPSGESYVPSIMIKVAFLRGLRFRGSQSVCYNSMCAHRNLSSCFPEKQQAFCLFDSITVTLSFILCC